MSEITITMKDGKIWISRGKEKRSRYDIILNDKNDDDVFLVGPYPQTNTMLLRLDHYHEIMNELRNSCPNAKMWRITAIVCISMFTVLSILFLLQTSYCRNLLANATELWKYYHDNKKEE